MHESILKKRYKWPPGSAMRRFYPRDKHGWVYHVHLMEFSFQFFRGRVDLQKELRDFVFTECPEIIDCIYLLSKIKNKINQY